MAFLVVVILIKLVKLYMKQKRKLNNNFWQEQVVAWKKSGLTMSEFSRQQGYNVNRLSYHNLKNGKSGNSKPIHKSFAGSKQNGFVALLTTDNEEKIVVTHKGFTLLVPVNQLNAVLEQLGDTHE